MAHGSQGRTTHGTTDHMIRRWGVDHLWRPTTCETAIEAAVSDITLRILRVRRLRPLENGQLAAGAGSAEPTAGTSQDCRAHEGALPRIPPPLSTSPRHGRGLGQSRGPNQPTAGRHCARPPRPATLGAHGPLHVGGLDLGDLPGPPPRGVWERHDETKAGPGRCGVTAHHGYDTPRTMRCHVTTLPQHYL